MQISSWNVNGIRAAHRGGFLTWFEDSPSEIVCVQETKARPEQVDEAVLHPKNYHSYWHSAEKPGYSGVAIFSKKEPLSVQTGMGVEAIDREGRVLVAEYPEFTLVNAYFPNSQREHTRLGYKLEFCAQMHGFLEKLRHKGKQVVICGDFNIAHQAIDLRNPKSNEKNAGYLPEERAWMTSFLEAGYVDAFRNFEKGEGHYTWWSYRPGVRAKNVGWRLDYFCVNQEFKQRLKTMVHEPQILGSDHCPISLTLKN